jgi:hypothetical protein
MEISFVYCVLGEDRAFLNRIRRVELVFVYWVPGVVRAFLYWVPRVERAFYTGYKD